MQTSSKDAMHSGTVMLRKDCNARVHTFSRDHATLLWFHANGRNMLGQTILRLVGQQCCVRLRGPLENG